MNYCFECGEKLIDEKCNNEGIVPYCPSCKTFRFKMFNTAISAIVLNPAKDKILLIQQYNKKDNILVAGYTNQGENIEETLIREVKEELGLNVESFRYMKSEYFQKSNTLMCNFVCVVDSDDLGKINYEVDKANWFTFEESLKSIKSESLAEQFLNYAINKMKKENIF